MSEKIEINTLITKHENKCNGCRFDLIDVEDPLWEYGSPLKRVLIDNQTGETYDSVSKLVGVLNEQQSTINELKSKLKEKEEEEDEELRKENEKLREENNFLKQIREAFQIDVKNSRQMLKRRGKYD